MIIGVGIDVADVARLEAALGRRAGLAERLFTPAELFTAPGVRRPAESLAARFAAKEALAKALGAPAGLAWLDAEITNEPGGRPVLAVTGTVAARADELGVRAWHVSLSHDGGVATAIVLAEG